MQTCGREFRRAPFSALARALIAVLVSLALVACSGGVVLEPAEGPLLEARKVAQAATLSNRITAIEPGNPAEIALNSSQVFFESAQVVVLVSSTAGAGISRAASVAVALGTPLLLTAPEGENIAGDDLQEQDGAGAKTGGLNAELLRLGTRAVLTVGEVSLHQLDTTSLAVQPVPEDISVLEEILGTKVQEVDAPEPADVIESLTTLDIGEIYPAPDLGETPAAYGSLPETLPAERNELVTVFTGSDPRNYAGAATARAAGARIFVGEDPASVTKVVDHLALHPSRSVVGIGEEFSDPQALQRVVASMHSGVILPSGAQRVFHANGEAVNLVTSYSESALALRGVDNAQDVLDLAEKRAGGAGEVTQKATVSGVEVSAAGNSREELEYWAEQAKSADQYLVLTIRPGGNLLDSVMPFESLLSRAHVGIRIEAAAKGTVDAGEVNDVLVYLRRLVREEKLPQKLVILDLGDGVEITNPDSLLTRADEVALTLSVNNGEEALWRTTREQFSGLVNWAVRIEEGDDPRGGDGETSREYPGIEDVLGKDEANLMTYR